VLGIRVANTPDNRATRDDPHRAKRVELSVLAAAHAEGFAGARPFAPFVTRLQRHRDQAIGNATALAELVNAT
jgi:hypothetical protein